MVDRGWWIVDGGSCDKENEVSELITKRWIAAVSRQ
jgi:uncharacterized membrane protein